MRAARALWTQELRGIDVPWGKTSPSLGEPGPSEHGLRNDYQSRQHRRVDWVHRRVLPHLTEAAAYIERVAQAAEDPAARYGRRRARAIRDAERLRQLQAELADLVIALLAVNTYVSDLVMDLALAHDKPSGRRPVPGLDHEIGSMIAKPNRIAGGHGKTIRLGVDAPRLAPAARAQVQVLRRLTSRVSPTRSARDSREQARALLEVIDAVDAAKHAGQAAAARLPRIVSPQPPPPTRRATRADPPAARELAGKAPVRRARQRQVREQAQELIARIADVTEPYNVSGAEIRALGWADLVRQLASEVSAQDCPCPGYCHRPPASPSEIRGLLGIMKLAKTHEEASGFAEHVTVLVAAEERMREETVVLLQGHQAQLLADGGTELAAVRAQLHLAETLPWLRSHWAPLARLLRKEAPALRSVLDAAVGSDTSVGSSR